MSPQLRWLLGVAAVAAWWVAGTVARPVDTGEPEEEPVIKVPVRAFADPDSAFGRALYGRLAAMSDRELSVLESGLSPAMDVADVADPDDDELMMGDMPLADDVSQQKASSSPSIDGPAAHAITATPLEGFGTESALLQERESTESAEMEDRNKKQRLQIIQNQIMHFMGWAARAPSPSPIMKHSSSPVPTIQQKDAIRLILENVNNFPSYPTDTFTEKTQSFYPICDLPKHTNDDIWNVKESMNLMFNVSVPKTSSGISVNVNMARLRLFKQLVSCNSQTSNETEDSQICQPTLFDESIKRTTNLSTSAEVPLVMEDRQIRVSIYAYTRSLKRKRVRRKLLDSHMMPYYGEKWTEWNIRRAVKAWRNNPSRNYGISIEVEDEDGNLLPVNRFFKPMNCTGDAQMTTSKPLPGFMMEAVQYDYGLPNAESNLNISSLNTIQALSFNVHRYPMIDVTTIEVPDSEAQNAMMFQYAKYAIEQKLAGKVSQPIASRPEEQAEHWIRHNSRHKINATDIEISGMKLSKDGRELRDQIIVQGVIQRNSKASPTEIPD